MYEIRLFSAAGACKALPSYLVGTSSFTLDQSGNYTDATVSLHAEADELISTGDRLEIWHQDVRRYRGYVSEIRRSEGEPAEIELTLYGRVLDLTKHVLQANYVYGSKTDLSRIFAEIATEFKARHADIVIETQTIGIEIDSLDTQRKDIKSTLDSLIAFAQSRATWGFDVDSEGRDRLFLRKISDESTADHVIPIPGASSGERETVNSVADVVNSVIVEGGAPLYPQMLPNPSFEQIWRAGEIGAGNLLTNSGFEQSAPRSGGGIGPYFWDVPNEYTLCSTQDGIAPFVGSSQVKLDRVGDAVTQTRIAGGLTLRHGNSYKIGAWIHPQPDAATEIDGPPRVTFELRWLDLSGDQVGDTFTKEFTCHNTNEWKQVDFVVPSPTDPLVDLRGYILTITDTSPGTAGTYRERGGTLLDEVFLQNASFYSPAGWQAIAYGTAQVYSLLCQPFSFGASHGRNAVAIQCRCEDADGDDILFRYSPSVRQQNTEWDRNTPDYTFQTIGGQKIRFSAQFYSQTGDVLPKMLFEFGWYRADNSEIRHDRTAVYLDDSKRDQWQALWNEQIAPQDAVRCETFISLRGDESGDSAELTLIIDAISARDANDPDIDTFLDAGNLVVQFDAEDEIEESENADAYNSKVIHGRREKVVSVSDLTSISDARQWAREYLLVNSVAVAMPTISLYDYAKEIKCGERVRLIGPSGARYSTGNLPVARLQGEVGEDGILIYTLELVRPVLTEEELYVRFLAGKRN